MKSIPNTLPAKARLVVEQKLHDLKAVLVEDDDGLFRLEEAKEGMDPAVHSKTIQNAWQRGSIKIDRYGHINILTATRVEMLWDHKALRRKSEDHLRKSSTVGDVVNLAISLGVQA